MRGDQRALEHPIRVAAEQLAVLERSGLAFGGVHDDGRRLERRRVGRDRAPLDAGRETGAAAAPEP